MWALIALITRNCVWSCLVNSTINTCKNRRKLGNKSNKKSWMTILKNWKSKNCSSLKLKWRISVRGIKLRVTESSGNRVLMLTTRSCYTVGCVLICLRSTGSGRGLTCQRRSRTTLRAKGYHSLRLCTLSWNKWTITEMHTFQPSWSTRCQTLKWPQKWLTRSKDKKTSERTNRFSRSLSRSSLESISLQLLAWLGLASEITTCSTTTRDLKLNRGSVDSRQRISTLSETS